MTGILDTVLDRTPIEGHEGRSGGRLERGVLPDGSPVVIKQTAASFDFAARRTGDTFGREARLWSTGVLDRLPSGVGHAILDARPVGDGWEILMRDVSDGLVRDGTAIDAPACAQIAGAMASLHATFLGEDVDGLAPLDAFVGLFGPDVAHDTFDDNPLLAAIARGWEAFPDLVPETVASAVAAVHADPGGIARALEEAGTPTLIHGDFFLQNLARYRDEVVLFDWGLATRAPGELEVAWFLTGTASRIPMSRERFVELYRQSCGARFSERAMEISYFAGLVLLGWNKALDITGDGDDAFRQRERADLDWWVERSEECLHAVWAPS